MSKDRTAHAYELELRKMIKSRTGADMEPWLLPQVRATAAKDATHAVASVRGSRTELQDHTKQGEGGHEEGSGRERPNGTHDARGTECA